MSITTKIVEEAHCNKCGHTWTIREDKDRSCPECLRKGSQVTRELKTRYLCLKCHRIWFGQISRCPDCGALNRDGEKKVVASDLVNVFTCGACGDTWVGEGLHPNEEYHKKCGCGREKATEAKHKRERDESCRITYGSGWAIYRGHTRHVNPKTGEWEPSQEEIDAKIATGIFKPPAPLIVTW